MSNQLESIRFLVVDDMMTMRKFVVQQLRMLGSKLITEASDGSKAWELLQSAAQNGLPFQFIVSDWNMPKMKGIELLKLCRSHEAYKDVAFLLVTAEQEVQQVKEAVSSGVDNYIVKPFNLTTFQEKLLTVHRKRFRPGKAKAA